jgi:chromosome segregation ATPase
MSTENHLKAYKLASNLLCYKGEAIISTGVKNRLREALASYGEELLDKWLGAEMTDKDAEIKQLKEDLKTENVTRHQFQQKNTSLNVKLNDKAIDNAKLRADLEHARSKIPPLAADNTRYRDALARLSLDYEKLEAERNHLLLIEKNFERYSNEQAQKQVGTTPLRKKITELEKQLKDNQFNNDAYHALDGKVAELEKQLKESEDLRAQLHLSYDRAELDYHKREKELEELKKARQADLQQYDDAIERVKIDTEGTKLHIVDLQDFQKQYIASQLRYFGDCRHFVGSDRAKKHHYSANRIQKQADKILKELFKMFDIVED